MTRSQAQDSSPETPSSSTDALADPQRIVDTVHEPLLVLDADLTVRQVNPAFYRVFSAAPDDTIGASLYELGGGHFDAPVLREALDRLLEQGEPFEQIELDRAFEGLGRRVLHINGRMLRAKADESDRLLLAINDVTDRRRMEETLRRRTEKLERSNADLEQFAYAASHDLQEPLRMVSSYLQLLERRYEEDLDETAREFIEYAVDGAERMKALINGLLQYSRVGRKEDEFEEVDLGEVLTDVLDDVAREIDRLGGTVTREALPTTYGSRDQLRRVFQNLIENALTYRGDAPPQIHVSGWAAPSGSAQPLTWIWGGASPRYVRAFSTRF